MPFKRVWDHTCPRVYEQWEDQGAKWIVQDLLPEDDEQAMEMMMDIFVSDETLCAAVGLTKDSASIRDSRKFWEECLSHRTSLACYRELDGKKELVALNMCPVRCADDAKGDEKFESEPWEQVLRGLTYVESKVNLFKVLNTDAYLGGAGLLVRRDIRGARLGARLLQAREPMCRALGIKGTSTIFTGVASQNLATRVGFQTVVEVSIAELADSGLRFSKQDTRILKLMVKKYD